jgi:hypothetical protein
VPPMLDWDEVEWITAAVAVLFVVTVLVASRFWEIAGTFSRP